MRFLAFEVIAGYPKKMPKEEMTAKINGMVGEIRQRLESLPGITMLVSEPSYRGKTEKAAEENPDQVRVLFCIKKKGRKTTWKDIMDIVNKTYVPYYRLYQS